MTRAIVSAVALVLLGLAIYSVWPLIGPLTVAMLLAYVLNPPVKWVMGHTRFSHKWSVSLVYFTVLAALIAAPGTLVPVVIRQAERLSLYFANVELQIEALFARSVDIFGTQVHLDRLWADFLQVATESLTAAEPGEALQVIETTSISVAWLLIILVGTFYLLLDGDGLRRWLIGLAPEGHWTELESLFQEINLIWRAYLRGTLALMLIVGIVFTIIWVAIGLPGAVVLGLLIGLLSVIPEIGPFIAGILAVAVAFVQGSDFLPLSNFWFAILVGAIYLVLIQIKAIWLRPRVMGRFLHMNEGLIFVAIVAAVVLQGILAALIVVPVLASLGAIGRYVRRKLLNLEPWPPAPPLAASASETLSQPSSLEEGIELANR